MKEHLYITSAEVAARACGFIADLPYDPRHEVIIRPAGKDRSAAQNALYWTWITIVAEHTGETKDEVHVRLKRKLLVRIYERDDPDGYGKMTAAVRLVHRMGHKDEAKALGDQIVKLTSTADATVEQMTEYLTDMEHDVWSDGISLPHPEDRYHEAMGR